MGSRWLFGLVDPHAEGSSAEHKLVMCTVAVPLRKEEGEFPQADPELPGERIGRYSEECKRRDFCLDQGGQCRSTGTTRLRGSEGSLFCVIISKTLCP